METFGEQRLGIHGQELPKFSDTDKMWWTKDKRYVVNPKNKSHILMKTQKEFWKKDDPIKLADYSENEPPQDKFKREYTKIV